MSSWCLADGGKGEEMNKVFAEETLVWDEKMMKQSVDPADLTLFLH